MIRICPPASLVSCWKTPFSADRFARGSGCVKKSMSWRHSASGLAAWPDPEGLGVGRAVAVPSTDDVGRLLLVPLACTVG